MRRLRLMVIVAMAAAVVPPIVSSARETTSTATAASPRTAARTPLTLKSVLIDKRGSTLLDAWSVSKGSATWSPPFGTATYTFALPSEIPSKGASVTLRVTATAAPTARFAPALGISGDVDIKGPEPFQARALAEPGQSAAASTTLKLVPRAYEQGFTVNVTVGLLDGPRVTYRYRPAAVETRTIRRRFSFDGQNKLGSRSTGSGVITETQRVEPGDDDVKVTYRANGTAAHVDEFFTKAQQERLTLVMSGPVKFDREGRDINIEATLAVRVTASNVPKSCAVGSRGELLLHEWPDGDDFIRLRVCGREHEHQYRHTPPDYRVKVSLPDVF